MKHLWSHHLGEDMEESLIRNSGPAKAAGCVILLVQPDPKIVNELHRHLSSDKVRILHVAGVAAAQEAISVIDIAAVILGDELDDGSGLSLLSELRQNSATVALPVLMVSTNAEAEGRAFGAGVDGYFVMPEGIKNLTNVLKTHLSRVEIAGASNKTDQLTGVGQHEAIVERMREITRAPIMEPASIVVLEFDRFKLVNERFGREIGDQALRQMIDTVVAALPEGGRISRSVGVEFILLLEGMDVPATTSLAQEILEAVHSRPLDSGDGETFSLTFSAGVAQLASDTDPSVSIGHADRLMQQARGSGGNRIKSGEMEPASPNRHRILVAEDDPVTSRILDHILSRAGFEVFVANNGTDAYEEALRQPVSLVLLDIMMPGMDGFEVLERLRRVPTYEKVPIVLLTSTTRTASVVKALEMGAQDYITKPFTSTEVVARVRRLIGSESPEIS